MRPPQRIDGFMAYDPQGKGDIDFLRRSPASCHSAVSNTLGMSWLAAVRQGWSVRPVSIVPAGEAEVELVDRPPTVELVAPPPPAVPFVISRPISPPRPRLLGGVVRLLHCGDPKTET